MSEEKIKVSYGKQKVFLTRPILMSVGKNGRQQTDKIKL